MNHLLKATPHRDALFTELDDGEAVLLDLQTHAYYGLNSTGRRIWQLLNEGLTLQEISCRLAEEFEAGGVDLQESVSEFVRELANARLVQLSD